MRWRAMGRVGSEWFRMLAARTAAVMMPLRDGPKTAEELAAAGIEGEEADRLLALLEALEYVERINDRYAATVPVLSAADRAMLLSGRRVGQLVDLALDKEGETERGKERGPFSHPGRLRSR
jgi:hypothetical protein